MHSHVSAMKSISRPRDPLSFGHEEDGAGEASRGSAVRGVALRREMKRIFKESPQTFSDSIEKVLQDKIDVDGNQLSPRQLITRAPYAIQTRGMFVDNSGNVGIGSTNTSHSELQL